MKVTIYTENLSVAMSGGEEELCSGQAGWVLKMTAIYNCL